MQMSRLRTRARFSADDVTDVQDGNVGVGAGPGASADAGEVLVEMAVQALGRDGGRDC